VNVRTSRIKTHAEPCTTNQRERSVSNEPEETLTVTGSTGVVYKRKDEMT